MKRIVSGGGLLVGALLGALALSACVKIVWQATYGAGDNGHNNSGTLVVSELGVFVAGATESLPGQGRNSGVFLSRFDRDGQLQWDLVIPVDWFEASRVAGGRVMAVDDGGNTFLAWPDLMEQRLMLYKVDAMGQLVSQWPAYSGMLASADDVKIGADGVVYVSARAGTLLKAYSNDGVLLWEAEYPAPVISGSIFSHQFQVATLHVLANGNVLLASIDALRLLSPDGVELQVLSTTNEGVDRFTRVSASGDRIWLVAVDDLGQGTLLGLSLELHEEHAQSLGSIQGHVFLGADESRLCLVTGPDMAQGNAVDLTVYQVSPTGETVATTPLAIPKAGYWQMEGVVAADAGCYVAEYSGEAGVSLTSRIRFLDGQGKQTDMVKVQDATIDDFAVKDGDIYRVGITGDYEGNTTEVSLGKHRRY